MTEKITKKEKQICEMELEFYKDLSEILVKTYFIFTYPELIKIYYAEYLL